VKRKPQPKPQPPRDLFSNVPWPFKTFCVVMICLSIGFLGGMVVALEEMQNALADDCDPVKTVSVVPVLETTMTSEGPWESKCKRAWTALHNGHNAKAFEILDE
jgi:hypothetical protein